MDPLVGFAGLFWIGFMIIFLIIVLIFLAGTILWFWMLIDVIVSDFKDNTEKAIWILVLLLTGLIGAIIYFIVVKNKRLGTKKKK